MAGSLVLIQETECAGVSTASVSLTGIDSTYDVIMCVSLIM